MEYRISAMPRPQAPPITVTRWIEGAFTVEDDQVAAEEPLQLLMDGSPWSIVMRTPGSDVELALGLLRSERVIQALPDVKSLAASAELPDSEVSETAVTIERSLLESNAVDVRLAPAAAGRVRARALPVSSACGVCGQTTVEELAHDVRALGPAPRLEAALLPRLAHRLRAAQGIFERTGGLHGAGLFTAAGEAVVVREDIGRHNAVDKVVGRSMLDARDLSALVLAVSGRVGYEVAQKAIVAGIPAVIAVGAPSSLAVEAARRFGLTLAGFVRDGRFNIYSGAAALTQTGPLTLA